MKLFIYSKTLQANGIKVIVDNLIEACSRKGIDCFYTNDLSKTSKDDIVLCYGVIESYENVKRGGITQVALLVDAISLGYLNKIKFYIKERHIFNYDFFYSIYAYLRFKPMEKKVCRSYDKLMLVSQTDIDYLASSFSLAKNKFICVPNGANLPKEFPQKRKSEHFRIGLLASWGAIQTYEESAWFVERYFKKFSAKHPNVMLYLAGRGEYMKRLSNIQNVVLLGEVPSLKDFFENIDLFVAVNPKGCGILNRVLDAFAHKVPIAAINASMSGFHVKETCYVPFEDYNTFENALLGVKNNSINLNDKVENGYNLILREHNWIKNYDEFVEQIINNYK